MAYFLSMTIILSPSLKFMTPGAGELDLMAFIRVGLIEVSSVVTAANLGLSSGLWLQQRSMSA